MAICATLCRWYFRAWDRPGAWEFVRFDGPSGFLLKDRTSRSYQKNVRGGYAETTAILPKFALRANLGKMAVVSAYPPGTLFLVRLRSPIFEC